MLIDNPESLQTWLTSYLEPLCDADPQALARYVITLIGKDKPTKELKHILSEQLEVFIQKETVPFVEVLFETIDNKSYIEPVHSDSHSTTPERSPSGGFDGEGALPSPIDSYGVHGNLASPLQSLSPEYEPKALQNLPDSSGSSAPVSQLTSSTHSKRSYHNRERSKSRSHSRSRSRSRSPPISSSQTRHRPRDVDMRRPGGFVPSNQGSGGSRGHFTDERNRRTGWNSPSSRGMSRRYGPSTTSSSSLSSSSHLGGGYRRNQQQINRRSRSRSKSRSPSRSRSRSYSPQPNRSPSHDRGRTKDKTRSNRSHNRVQSTSRSRSRNRDGPAPKRTRVSSKSPVDENTEEEKEEKPSFTKKRCRDYDERGFCMRGDLCQFDHGSDPVVLDGAVSSVVLGLTANGAPSLAAPQNVSTVGSANFLNEPYNPEAPGIDKQISPNGNRRGSGVGSLANPLCGSVPPLSENCNIPQQSFWKPIPPPLRSCPLIKSTIDAPTASSASTSGNPLVSSFINKQHNNLPITPKRSRGKRNRSRRRGGTRGGYIKQLVNNEKCTLELRKIPPNLNTITNLNSHFSKFGSIVNLQVGYNGDPRAALIKFVCHKNALAAYKSTEAVFNNRFVKVFWHPDNQKQAHNQQQSFSLSHPLTNQEPDYHQHQQNHHNHSPSSEYIDQQYYFTNEITDSNEFTFGRSNIKERLEFRDGIEFDRDMTISTNFNNFGSISRTVYNPALMKSHYTNQASSTSNAIPVVTRPATTKTPSFNNNPSVKPELNGEGFGVASFNSRPTIVPPVVIERPEDIKRDKILTKLDLQKKRQQILVCCMQDQKLLIGKLEKAKSDKEKMEIRSTVEIFDKQITKLKSEIKKDTEIILTEIAELPSSIRKNKIQIEKGLLDVEMDFYNELHNGATASELNKKLQELKIKAKALCMNDLRSTKNMIKRFAKMRIALRDRNRLANHTLAKNFENLRKVDRRTRKIFIEGVTANDTNLLLSHLSQSAEIESLETTPRGVMVTFKTRRDAEMALPLISTVKLKGSTPLKASWFDEAVLCSSLLCYISFLCPN